MMSFVAMDEQIPHCGLKTCDHSNAIRLPGNRLGAQGSALLNPPFSTRPLETGASSGLAKAQ